MHKALLYTLLAAIFIIGCAKEPEPEPEIAPPPPPPPPTPQEVADKILADVSNPTADELTNPQKLEGSKALLSQQKAQLAATQDGKETLQIVSRTIDQKLRGAVNNEDWPLTFYFSDLHITLNPDSTRFLSERTRAISELKKPVVTIKGLINDKSTGRRIAHLDIYLPLERRTASESMKLGDQLYGIRFAEIIGKNQGIVFDYLETGESFEVLTKAASR
jgi:hypothetical protein